MFTHPLFFLSLLFLAVFLEVVGDVSFKFSYLQGRPLYLWIGVAFYAVATIIWALSLRYEYLSKAISIFTIVNLIAVMLVGFLVFKEDISLVNKLGIGLGVVSVILMQL